MIFLRPNSRFLGLAVLFLCVSCSNSSAPVASNEVATETQSPNWLQALLTSPRPLEIYQEAYGAFRFVSETAFLSATAEDETPERTATTRLEIDANNNVHLFRRPLNSEGVEFYQVQRRTFIKRQNDVQFNQVAFHPEFRRWMETSLKEVLALFQTGGFDERESFSEDAGLRCWVKPIGRLCVDPATSLPRNGWISPAVGEKSKLRVEFSLETTSEEPIEVRFDPTSNEPDQKD